MKKPFSDSKKSDFRKPQNKSNDYRYSSSSSSSNLTDKSRTENGKRSYNKPADSRFSRNEGSAQRTKYSGEKKSYSNNTNRGGSDRSSRSSAPSRDFRRNERSPTREVGDNKFSNSSEKRSYSARTSSPHKSASNFQTQVHSKRNFGDKPVNQVFDSNRPNRLNSPRGAESPRNFNSDRPKRTFATRSQNSSRNNDSRGISMDSPKRAYTTRSPRSSADGAGRFKKDFGERKSYQSKDSKFNRDPRSSSRDSNHNYSRSSSDRYQSENRSPNLRADSPSYPRTQVRHDFRRDKFSTKKPNKNRDVSAPVKNTDNNTDRLQKALSAVGWGSRREIEEWIKNGMVFINGKCATIGESVKQGDKIEIINNPLAQSPERLGRRDRGRSKISRPEKSIIYRPNFNLPRILLYHKPEGEIVSKNDPQGRPTVFEKLPKIYNGKWINIGRLDFLTSGLLLFTDNGEIANKLMHPSSNLEREYAVRIAGILGEGHISQLIHGIELDDGLAKCEEVKPMGGKDEGRNRWYKMIITEGRNREIRKMVEALELQVSRLMRVRYGPVLLPRALRRGNYLELTPKEVEKILTIIDNT